MKQLNLSQMEQLNGGSDVWLGAACGGAVAACGIYGAGRVLL